MGSHFDVIYHPHPSLRVSINLVYILTVLPSPAKGFSMPGIDNQREYRFELANQTRGYKRSEQAALEANVPSSHSNHKSFIVVTRHPIPEVVVVGGGLILSNISNIEEAQRQKITEFIGHFLSLIASSNGLIVLSCGNHVHICGYNFTRRGAFQGQCMTKIASLER